MQNSNYTVKITSSTLFQYLFTQFFFQNIFSEFFMWKKHLRRCSLITENTESQIYFKDLRACSNFYNTKDHFFFNGHSSQPVDISLLTWDWSLGPKQWKLGAITIGPPGKSQHCLEFYFKCLFMALMIRPCLLTF